MSSISSSAKPRSLRPAAFSRQLAIGDLPGRRARTAGQVPRHRRSFVGNKAVALDRDQACQILEALQVFEIRRGEQRRVTQFGVQLRGHQIDGYPLDAVRLREDHVAQRALVLGDLLERLEDGLLLRGRGPLRGGLPVSAFRGEEGRGFDVRDSGGRSCILARAGSRTRSLRLSSGSGTVRPLRFT